MQYRFTPDDFERAFKFGIDMYLSKGPHTGRTSGEPRGLGAVLDAFTRGKLVEIGVGRMLEEVCDGRRFILDFDMKSISEVAEEPDITDVEEGGEKREPIFFIEIKNTSTDDRWIGLTDEQLATMSKGAADRDIYIIYASLHSCPLPDSPPSSDFVGMYLRHLSDLPIFKGFAELNAEARLEFILSAESLHLYGTSFPKGDLMYETDLFSEGRIRRTDGSLLASIEEEEHWEAVPKRTLVLRRQDNEPDDKYGSVDVAGSFTTYIKRNPKSFRHYIECHTDTVIESDIFGNFCLMEGHVYNFSLVTLGRDPVLKRNNLLVSKRRIYQLIAAGKLDEPEAALSHVACRA